MDINKLPLSLGALKKSNYRSKTVKDEIRANVVARIAAGKPVFEGVLGYENTVLPDVERALLSRHNINFLGLRGQAKTRMARELISLLDEYIPVVAGSAVMDDPLDPISTYAIDTISQHGDETPITWIHRHERYSEKLATPDVTVADLIGDADPIKAANLKLDYSDERVIHFGLIPRANRGIFVINELPDLQPRIQVALFNILQEGDIQIRGFKLRLPLDIMFVFTANPEDYTNRGAIITPLKDRIQSQILTHYPKSIRISAAITRQEARIAKEQSENVTIPSLLADLVEQIAVEARNSEYIDQKSGVSARFTISAYESLASTVERRLLLNNEKKGSARLGDLLGVLPAMTGKMELVYEGEQEGQRKVALRLMGKAIRTTFAQYFPDPELFKKKKKEEPNPYQGVINYFNKHELELLADLNEADYREKLDSVDGLRAVVTKYNPKTKAGEQYLLMEFVLHGLAEYSQLSKSVSDEGLSFGDLFNSVFSADYDGGGE